MNEAPLFSVIMPAYRAAGMLPDTLGALHASSLPRARWELLVVDDASPDTTGAVAEAIADVVLRLTGSPRGPGHARNAAASVAKGRWLVFVDADIRVHQDTLVRFMAAITTHPEAAAIFGAYDAHPAAGSLISQYRNLLHRYVHLTGAGPAETFWAGLGAVRRDWFARLGGFDTRRYPTPQIEDIELGYRLRDLGGEIILDPSIQGTHLKRWTLAMMLRTDFRDRAVPWMQLLLERQGRSVPSLNVGWTERAKVGVAAVALVAPVAALVLGTLWPLGVLGLGAALLAAWNLPMYRWFAGQRGLAFTAAVLPLHLAYYGTSAVAAVTAILRHGWRRFRTAQTAPAA